MNNWFTTPQGTWDKLWQVLAQGVADGQHPARLPSFATTAPDGWPQVRTVVLRAADPEAATVSVHTDLHSDKIKSLRAHPKAALHIWDADAALQIRMQADVSISSGDETRALWHKIPDHAQQAYGVTPPPGTPINAALDYDKTPDPDTFAVLTCQLVHIDAVYLGEHHRRIAFSRARQWQGQWLSP